MTGRGPASSTDARDDRHRLFAALARPETSSSFFERVADDVDWTVQGTHPISGRYTDKQRFVAATFDRLAAIMRDGIQLEVTHLFLDGTTAVAELRALSTTLEGMRYDNTFCWVCRFDSDRPGARIVEVRAYLDSALVTWALARNEQRDRP